MTKSKSDLSWLNSLARNYLAGARLTFSSHRLFASGSGTAGTDCIQGMFRVVADSKNTS